MEHAVIVDNYVTEEVADAIGIDNIFIIQREDMEVVETVFDIQRRGDHQSLHPAERPRYVGLKLQIGEFALCGKLQFTMVLAQLQIDGIVVMANVIIVIEDSGQRPLG